jgi:hypothetical protein
LKQCISTNTTFIKQFSVTTTSGGLTADIGLALRNENTLKPLLLSFTGDNHSNRVMNLNTTAIKLNKTTTWNRALTIESDVSSKTTDNIQRIYFTPDGINGSTSIIETPMFGN